jgi:hypothetical protein
MLRLISERSPFYLPLGFGVVSGFGHWGKVRVGVVLAA